MEEKAQRIILLGGDYGALGVAKALARQGLRVVLLSPKPHDHACHSRSVSELVLIPDPMKDDAGLLQLLMDHRGWEGILLIPTLDEYVIFVSQNREVLGQKYIFAVENWEVTKRVILKEYLYPVARELGVPTPHFFLPDSTEFLRRHESEFSYPCIIKPSETVSFQKAYHRKVLLAHDFQELLEKFEDTQRRHFKVMISEIIPGSDTTLFSYHCYIDSQGQVLAEMCCQKLRQNPAGFGQGSVIRTVPLIPEIRGHTLALLRKLSYRGESAAEYKLDARDRQYKLMEINARPEVTEWLFVSAGENFPYLTYQDLVHNVRTPVAAYRHGLYWIQLSWEISIFFRRLKQGRLNLKEFLMPYGHPKVYGIPLWDDPLHLMIDTYYKIVNSLKHKRIRKTEIQVKPG